MALMYTYGVLLVIGMIILIWTHHELNKPEQTEDK